MVILFTFYNCYQPDFLVCFHVVKRVCYYVYVFDKAKSAKIKKSKYPKESKRIQKNPKESKRIQKNPKESKRIQKNPKESKRIQSS